MHSRAHEFILSFSLSKKKSFSCVQGTVYIRSKSINIDFFLLHKRSGKSTQPRRLAGPYSSQTLEARAPATCSQDGRGKGLEALIHGSTRRRCRQEDKFKEARMAARSRTNRRQPAAAAARTFHPFLRQRSQLPRFAPHILSQSCILGRKSMGT
jgi:hypothetical protein